MPTLRASLQQLAQSFAEQVMETIRGANLAELLEAERGGGRAGRGGTTAGNPKVAVARPGKPARLPRRSAEEIDAALQKIVLLVKTHKTGMRAEEIRAAFGMQAKEMPRVLKQGVAARKLKTKGRKRATTYFAA
jgi:hypothetical protein